MNILKIAGIGIGAGILGVLLALAGWHLWIDHANIHALVGIENARAEAAQKAQRAQPPPQ